MIIVATSNYDRDGYHETVIAKECSEYYANWIARLLNISKERMDEDYYRIFPDDYEPRRF